MTKVYLLRKEELPCGRNSAQFHRLIRAMRSAVDREYENNIKTTIIATAPYYLIECI